MPVDEVPSDVWSGQAGLLFAGFLKMVARCRGGVGRGEVTNRKGD